MIGRVLADCTNRSIDVAAFGTFRPGRWHHAGRFALRRNADHRCRSGRAMRWPRIWAISIGAIGSANIDPTGAVYVCGPREATMIKILAGSTKFDNPSVDHAWLAGENCLLLRARRRCQRMARRADHRDGERKCAAHGAAPHRRTSSSVGGTRGSSGQDRCFKPTSSASAFAPMQRGLQLPGAAQVVSGR